MAVPTSIPRLTLFVLVAVSGACRNPTEQLLDRAHRALEEDDYQTATQLLREVTIASPESPLAATAHYELAQIYHLRVRDLPAAEASLLKILNDYPESAVVASAHALLGRMYERDLGAPEKAPTHYEEALLGLGVDEQRDILLALGDCYYRLDRVEDAASSYRRAIQLPYAATADAAYLRLAMISHLGGTDEESMALLEELRALSADTARRQQALRLEVEILIGAKRFSEAGERLRRAETEFPERGQLDELYGRLEQEQIAEATRTDEGASPEELEKRIHWGSGRRRAREPR